MRYGREEEDVEREGEREGGERERERERKGETDSHIFLPIMFTAQQNKIKPKQEHKLK